jgi:hypothetical protein
MHRSVPEYKQHIIMGRKVTDQCYVGWGKQELERAGEWKLGWRGGSKMELCFLQPWHLQVQNLFCWHLRYTPFRRLIPRRDKLQLIRAKLRLVTQRSTYISALLLCHSTLPVPSGQPASRPTVSMEHRPSSEADSLLSGQEITRHLWNLKIDCRSRWSRGLRRSSCPIRYWDRGFEFRSVHGFLSLCFCAVLFCIGRGLCDGLIALKRSPSKCLNKVKKPVWGGQCFYKDCRSVDDDENSLPCFLSAHHQSVSGTRWIQYTAHNLFI